MMHRVTTLFLVAMIVLAGIVGHVEEMLWKVQKIVTGGWT